MFIGNNESSYEFGRGPDRMPRKKRGQGGIVNKNNVARVAGGVAAAGAVAAGLKNKKAIGGLAKKAGQYGQAAGIAGEAKVRQVARKTNARAKDAFGGVSSAAQGGARDARNKFNQARTNFQTRQQNRRKKQTQTMKIANQMRNRGG